jgi:hypothetical protein
MNIQTFRFGALSVSISLSAFTQQATADSDCDSDTDSEWNGCNFIFEAVSHAPYGAPDDA